jgi:hypothetical protein
MRDYSDIDSLSREQFESLGPTDEEVEDENLFTKSDDEDIRKIERLLDLVEETLASQDFYLERVQCVCGRTLTFSDFISSALIDTRDHTKSLIFHTIDGIKYVRNNPRPIRCSVSGHLTAFPVRYRCRRYRCT